MPELIEPEFIEVKTSQRERKPKADYDEMFANLPIHYEEVNTLSEEDRQCPACGSGMRRYGQNSVIPGQSWSVSCTLPPPMDVRPVKTRRTRSSSKTKGARHLSRADMLLHPRCHISCMKNMQMRFLCTGRRRDLNFLESVSAERPWRIGSSPAPRTI